MVIAKSDLGIGTQERPGAVRWRLKAMQSPSSLQSECCDPGVTVWQHIASDGARDPEIVLACAGDALVAETTAAADMLGDDVPDLRVQVVVISDLATLAPAQSCPHGMVRSTFEQCYGVSSPVLLAHDGDPSAVAASLRERPGAERFRVHGCSGVTGLRTPYEFFTANKVSRHDVAIDALNIVRPASSSRPWSFDRVAEHYALVRRVNLAYLKSTGEDPERASAASDTHQR